MATDFQSLPQHEQDAIDAEFDAAISRKPAEPVVSVSTAANDVQMATIRTLALTHGVDPYIECRKAMQLEMNELDITSADRFIHHLRGLPFPSAAESDEPGDDWAEKLGDEYKAQQAKDDQAKLDEKKLITETKARAEENTSSAATSVHSELVPEFGNVLASREPTAIAFGFPPAVDALIKKAKLNPEQTTQLLSKFGDLFSQMDGWRSKLDAIVITGVEDTEAIAAAKELFKAIQTDRLNVEKRKQIIKEPYLKPAQLIDGVFRVYMDEITPLERAALAKAKYIENLENERKEKIRAHRVEQLAPFVENIAAFNLHPDVMTDEAFDTVLATQKELHAARQAQAEREAQERQRREDEAAAERVRLRRQTERRSQLSAMGFTRDEENKRMVLDVLNVYDIDIDNEVDATWTKRVEGIAPMAEAIRLDLKEKQDAADRLIREKAEAERLANDAAAREAREREAALLAPDKVKLTRLAEAIDAIEFFDTTNEKVIEILGEVKMDLYNAATKLRRKIDQLP